MDGRRVGTDTEGRVKKKTCPRRRVKCDQRFTVDLAVGVRYLDGSEGRVGGVGGRTEPVGLNYDRKSY